MTSLKRSSSRRNWFKAQLRGARGAMKYMANSSLCTYKERIQLGIICRLIDCIDLDWDDNWQKIKDSLKGV